ncbi:FAD-dependent oxidoreductase [uncultured Kordia sp.]|uniref:FAD-dependent oxidoreductase n=1 Tax=uncultured Kordia sp. TaxID=507699 RepID=UPI0026329A50|nr:FAD-dependent oxidoreductase [uncultured Kordia sp.]
MKPLFIKNAPTDLKIIDRDNSLYHYARVISNTRFGHMPIYIAYCKNADHVSYCINHCRDHKIPFRIRSGGHQHEGMCSGKNVIIIDVSEINKITYESDTVAWIPAGKQLGQVYDELAKKGKTVPGGGCQSVNVGGLTQGGGWGVSVRKYGLTCDSVTDIEIVLASGKSVIANADNKYSDLFKALKGGGGGNFGVVIRFRFKLVSILPVITNFTIRWEKPDEIKGVITKWAELHAKENGIDEALSATCTMLIAKSENEKKHEVHGRMAGKFYGSEKKLRGLLETYFKGFIPTDDKAIRFTQIPEDYADTTARKNATFSVKKQTKASTATLSYATSQRLLIDFINPTGSIQFSNNEQGTCKKLDLTVLPDKGPSSTCDRPHPHKVSSSFPKDNVNHRELAEAIYTYLDKSCYHADVNMYMSFHCMGGAVTRSTGNSFGYSQKPYMLQIQAWWDDVSNAFTNEGRNTVYLKWVKDFRESIAIHTEGSFINFVDKTLVPDIEKDENRLKLLKIYYNDKLKDLRTTKKKYDPEQLFHFEMSILPE